ncbi:hypothetical protein [Peptoniphilus sp. oral taxon 836]|nr:hypothetical protein [Peptoniphilus sp. oral taxon 836]
MDFLEIAKKRQSTRNFDPSKKSPSRIVRKVLISYGTISIGL